MTELRPGGSPQARIAPRNLFEYEFHNPPALHKPYPATPASRSRLPTPATSSGLLDEETHTETSTRAQTPSLGDAHSRAQTPGSVASAPAATRQRTLSDFDEFYKPSSTEHVKRPATSLEGRRRYLYPDGKKTYRLPPVVGEMTVNPKRFHANSRVITFNKTAPYEVRIEKQAEKEHAEKAAIVLTREGNGWKMNHRARKHALEKLAQIGPVAAEYAEVVAKFTDDDDWVVRKAAAEALGAMGHAAGAHAPRVAALLGDPTVQCRKAGIKALAQMGEKADASFNKVVGRVIGNGYGSCDSSNEVRWTALTHLPNMGY